MPSLADSVWEVRAGITPSKRAITEVEDQYRTFSFFLAVSNLLTIVEIQYAINQALNLSPSFFKYSVSLEIEDFPKPCNFSNSVSLKVLNF
jgi:hypothetical protein